MGVIRACVLIFAAYEVPKNFFCEKSGSTLAGPHNVKGLFEGYNMILRLRLDLNLGLGLGQG